MKIKLKRWYKDVADCDAMTRDEFDSISGDKFTPDLVYITDEGKLLYNEFTCTSSYRYGGTCNCISHSPKKWINFTNEIKEILE